MTGMAVLLLVRPIVRHRDRFAQSGEPGDGEARGATRSHGVRAEDLEPAPSRLQLSTCSTSANSRKMVYRGGCGSALDAERASPSMMMNGSRSVRARAVVDDAGKVILQQQVPTEPADIIAFLTSLGVTYSRIGIEAGPL